MRLAIDPQLLIAFLFASTRCAAFLFIAPPFQGLVPPTARAGLALVLGMSLAPQLAASGGLPVDDTVSIIGGLLFQVGVGLALGFLVYVIFQAAMTAGSMIDYFGGLTSAQLFDPMTRSQMGPMGRFYQLMATVVLFATGGHLLLIGGLFRSFDAAPVSGLRLDRLGVLLTRDVGQFMVAAIQIGAPVLGALFITELLVGLASKAAPQLNVMVLGFSVKSLVVLVLSGLSLPLLIAVVPHLVSDALGGMWALVR